MILLDTGNAPLALDRYLAIKREFLELSESAAQSFLRDSEDTDLVRAWRVSEGETLAESVADWGRRCGCEALDCVTEKAVKTLTDAGCFSIDEEVYRDEYLDDSALEKCVESGIVMTALQNVEDEENAREGARRIRTAEWGSMWTGGTLGGGIKGALKGALKAEVMNVGGALLSGAVNKIGRSRSQKDTLQEADRLFGLFRIEMSEAVRLAIMASLTGYVRCLNENLNSGINDEWPGRDDRAAKGLLGNLAANRVPEEQRAAAIRTLIRLNPFSEESYDWIYRNETTLRAEVVRVADYFCVRVQARIDDEAEKEEAQKRQARRAAKAKRKNDEAARKADEATRTAFGKVWPSVVEMESARADKQKFFECVELLVGKYPIQDGTVGSQLSEKKRSKIQVVFELLPDERILWLLDTSAWYNASYGLVVTDKGLRWKNRDAGLSKINCLSWFQFGQFDKPPRILEDKTLRLAQGARVDMDANINWKEKWLPVIVSLWNFWREGTFEKNDEVMVLPPKPVTIAQTEENESGDSVPQNLEEMILKAIADVGGGIYCKPNISEKKLINARLAMKVPLGETVVALMDTTFFGSAKTGAVLTDWGVRWANDWATESKKTALSWQDLRSCRPYAVKGCDLTLTTDAVINTAGGGMSAENLSKAIEAVAINCRCF